MLIDVKARFSDVEHLEGDDRLPALIAETARREIHAFGALCRQVGHGSATFVLAGHDRHCLLWQPDAIVQSKSRPEPGERAPRRIQRRRTKGWKKPEGAVNVARPSKWGNPFRPSDYDKITDCLAEYRIDLLRKIDNRELDLAELRGRDLMCWCKEGAPCHADILLAMANDWWPYGILWLDPSDFNPFGSCASNLPRTVS